jgi:two-component system response regulator
MLKPGSRVLLIEDADSDASLFRRAYEKAGVHAELVVAPDGASARAALESGLPPCLVVTDARVPGDSGADLVREIRNRKGLETTPIVVFSGATYLGDVRAMYAAGANSVVVKPVDFEQYQQAVGQILQYWLCKDLGCWG